MSSTVASPETGKAAGAPTDAQRFIFTLWTADPERARAADRAGVDRIGLDLERLGKRERQLDPRLWQTTHREESLPVIGASLTRAQLFARSNPPHADWSAEADRLIAAGVQVLMLPAFHSADEVRAALDAVGGRARLVPLIETVSALRDAEAIAALPGLSEVHFGLNDLAIGMGLTSRFAVLAQPDLGRAARTIRAAGIRVGVGGIGRAGDAQLPLPSDLVYAQYPRLGATGALIARSFFEGLPPGADALAAAIAAARARLDYWYRCDDGALDRARAELESCVAAGLA
jgi:2-keto-3-deoxy-L-rhamnonate aldolase RhmA